MKSFIKILFVTAIILFIAVIVVGVVEINQIYTARKIEAACGKGSRNGIWLIDSTGKSTYVNMKTYVDEVVAVNETATTSYGVNYSKEGEMTLLDVDCDIKEAFEILDSVKMHVEIKIGDKDYYQAYAKGSDGFTYLVETDKNGNILRDSEGNVKILKRCDFADLYLGEE